MTTTEASRYLIALPRFAGREDAAYKPGLERIRVLLEAMDAPHERFRSVHVAGSHGKGTVASLAAAVGSAAGLRVGLHTSPHLVRLHERMRLNGTPAPGDWLAKAVERYRSTFEEIGPSFFEATVALSFLFFAEKEVDVAVVEVGLGGRLDATNVLRPDACAITAISTEHTDLLGETLAEVAREKGGILKSGVPALVGTVPPEAQEAIRVVAAKRGAPLHHVPEETALHDVRYDNDGLILDAETPLRRYDDLRLPLYGQHQAHNALTALRLGELFLEDLQNGSTPAYDGLAGVRRLAGLRGRFEVLRERPLVAADVAHHPDSIAALLRALHAHFPDRQGRLVVALGLMRDKDAEAVASILSEAGAEGWPVALDTERALPPRALAQLLRKHGVPVGATRRADAHRQHFLAGASPGDVLLLCGSHRVVAGLGPF